MIRLLLLCCVLAPCRSAPADPTIPAAVSLFNQRLYSYLATYKTEMVYSPLSIHSALAMTSLGAKGRTAAEMAVTLSVAGDRDPHSGYQGLIAGMTADKDTEVYIGNGVFMNPPHPVEQDFLNKVQTLYNGTAQTLDMSAAGGPEVAVNDFVREHTGGLLPRMLKPNTITPDTVMVLINTVYFNASWAQTFPLHNTGRRSFKQMGGATSQVDMMQDDRMVFLKRDAGLGADVLQLALKGSRFSLYIVLPQAVEGLADVESRIAGLNVPASLFSGLTRQLTHVVIPKFKVESSFELKMPLQQMGMTAAFDPSLADFTGITREPGTYISAVQHKAVVEVQESGVTASAATAVVFIRNLVMLTPERFIADHPFIFFLRDDQTQTVLFQGKYSG